MTDIGIRPHAKLSTRGCPMPEKTVMKFITLETKRSGDCALVLCHGRLVSGGTDILYNEVKPLIPECKRIVLDLTDLEYVDSTGLGTLVRLYASAKSSGCTLELIHIGKRVKELLGLTNLWSVFAIIGENNMRM
jgi:anti-sigma B factor antagonist